MAVAATKLLEINQECSECTNCTSCDCKSGCKHSCSK